MDPATNDAQSQSSGTLVAQLEHSFLYDCIRLLINHVCMFN